MRVKCLIEKEDPGKYDYLRISRGLQVGVTGTEQPRDFAGNSGVFESGGAESGALGAQTAPIDPELGEVIDAWPALPNAIKAGILAMVRTAGGTK